MPTKETPSWARALIAMRKLEIDGQDGSLTHRHGNLCFVGPDRFMKSTLTKLISQGYVCCDMGKWVLNDSGRFVAEKMLAESGKSRDTYLNERNSRPGNC